MKLIARCLPLTLFVLGAVPVPGLTQGRVPDLIEMSIEELMKIEVTSVSRKEQRAADVAAAIFVLTHDEIHRSGMTTIPDLLRLVPGVEVAQINSNKWAVTIRGFNSLNANKLLVLIDGRSLYNRIFGGVVWDIEDLMLDDVERIEVIRGPSAATWGANAVNGVINIITKGAADTQGLLVRAEGGRSGELGAIRYGGTLGSASYRLFSQWTGRNQSLLAPGTRANDASHSTTTGLRADWTTQPDTFVFEGAFTAGQTRALWFNLDPQTFALEPISHETSDAQSGYLLGRYTRTRASGASLQVQSFMDVSRRQETVANYGRQVFDLDTQYRMVIGARQDLVAGVGYRSSRESLAGRFGISLAPAEDSSSLLTAFAQDEIALFGNRLMVTLGTQLQYVAVSGVGVQPTARVMWKARPSHRLWAATSRAIRTPALIESGLRLTFPPVPTDSGLPLVVTVTGSPGAEAENLVDAEAGYRFEIGTTVSIDVTGYVGRYTHLRTLEPGAPSVEFVPSPRILVTSHFSNLVEATTRGFEIAARWTPVAAWRLDASYTAVHVIPNLATATQDPSTDGSAPRAQWQVRSAFSPDTHATVNVAIFHVGRLEQLQVDGYTRADLSAEWRFTRGLSVMAIGQNLLDEAHPEFPGATSFLLGTQVPRSASLRVRWTF
jgi:iron complex outermembrane receptor protein